MANGSGDRGGDDGVEIEDGVVATPQAVLKYLLCFDGLQDDMKVEGEGGVVVTEIDEVEDIVFLLEKMFNEGKGVLKGGGVEKRRRHCKRGWF